MSINAITGYSGIYDGVVASSPIRYGMNAANNMEKFTRGEEIRVQGAAQGINYEPFISDDFEIFATALEKFAESLEQDTFTPAQYRYQYSTVDDGKVNKLSLLGASYEEMGRKSSLPVRTVTKMLQKFYPAEEAKSKKDIFNAKPLDTNNNKKIETEEYAAFLALADIKSKDKDSEDVSIMDGNITNKGVEAALSYLAVGKGVQKAAPSEDKKLFKPSKLVKNMRNTFANIQANLGLQGLKAEFGEEVKHIDFKA